MIHNTDSFTQLITLMEAQQLDLYLVPLQDEYFNETVPLALNRLRYLTQFTGSSGYGIVEKATGLIHLFSDHRYEEQITVETDSKRVKGYMYTDLTPQQFLQNLAKQGSLKVGYYPFVHSYGEIKQFTNLNDIQLIPTDEHYVDKVWHNKPQFMYTPVKAYTTPFVSLTAKEKQQQMQATLQQQKATGLVISATDSLVWLLDIRANDVPNTPLVCAWGILLDNGNCIVVTHNPKRFSEEWLASNSQVKVIEPKELSKHLQGQVLLVHEKSLSAGVYQLLATNNQLINLNSDPVQLPKAKKSLAEVEGIYQAHIIDAVSYVHFLHWLYTTLTTSTTDELTATQELLKIRQQQAQFLEPSFNTICGSGSNGSLMHYRATPLTNQTIEKNKPLLIDCGGQYYTGTTDVTRCFVFGEATSEYKKHYTLVLKAHLAMAKANFIKGTAGQAIDAMVRMHLWRNHMNFNHGTGHGVGTYLSVHEGPQSISQRSSVALEPYMVVTNEPGHYIPKAYGIRIENMLYVDYAQKEDQHNPMRHYKLNFNTHDNVKGDFLCFRNLTLIPYDTNPLNLSLLSKSDIEWINAYHEHIYTTLQPLLPPHLESFLRQLCKAI